MTEVVNGYCTIDEARLHLEDDAERLSAERLAMIINAVSRGIDNYCFGPGKGGFYLPDTVSVRYFETVDTGFVVVDPIATTTGLIVATDDAGNGTYSTVWATSDYRLTPINGPVYTHLEVDPIRGGRAFNRRGYVKLTAKWGYPETPAEVTEAALLKMAGLFARKDAPFGVATFGDFAAVRVTRRDPDVMELLQPFVLDVAMVG